MDRQLRRTTRTSATSIQGDGVKFAGTGWIQVTGQAQPPEVQRLPDQEGSVRVRKVMEDPADLHRLRCTAWSIGGNWWDLNGMNAYTNGDPPIQSCRSAGQRKYTFRTDIQDRRDLQRACIPRARRIPAYPGN